MGGTGPSVVHGRQSAPDFETFLEKSFDLSSDEREALVRGDVVAHALQKPNRRDVAVFGVLRLDVPRSVIASRLSNTETALTRSGRRFQILNQPPLPDDFTGITRTSRDANALRRCRVGSCDFKLAATDIQALRDSLGGANDSVVATEYERGRLDRIAREYLRRGNDAMPVYADNEAKGISGRTAFDELVARLPSVDAYAPGLSEYLSQFPDVQRAGAADVLYWARDEIAGMRPILTLNQRIVYSTSAAPGTTTVATKEIVADHYLEAALELILIVDRPELDGRGAYVMTLRAYRFDQIPTAFRISLRGRVVGKLRDRMRADLTDLKLAIGSSPER